MPDRFHSDTLLLHSVFLLYDVGGATLLFNFGIRSKKRWIIDKSSKCYGWMGGICSYCKETVIYRFSTKTLT